MRSGTDSRMLISAVLALAVLVSCTSTSPPTPAPQASPIAKPASSPSPVAATSPTPLAPRPIAGGGAAQPRAAATFQSIGGSGLVIVPTPNFAANPTKVPAPLAPAVALQTVQPAAVVQVSGTLSRIPTAIPSGGGGGGGGAGSGSSGSTSNNQTISTGAAVSQLTIGAVVTSTPLVRVNPQPQPTIAFPGR
ncbi:MAG: hypothetical protein AB7P40_17350 [Chloroflexota bacterium]